MSMSKTPFYYYIHYPYANLRTWAEYYNLNPMADKEDLDEVYENIYVGNISTACNKDKLEELGIKNVITAISGVPEIYKDINYKLVDVLDITKQNMIPVFDDTSQFIEDSLKDGGKVYVHCMCGVSRSVSIVCAYLAKKHGIDPITALDMIKKNRAVANPNPSFMQQLENYFETVSEKKNESLPDVINE